MPSDVSAPVTDGGSGSWAPDPGAVPTAKVRTVAAASASPTNRSFEVVIIVMRLQISKDARRQTIAIG
jgi:hypothetical protein